MTEHPIQISLLEKEMFSYMGEATGVSSGFRRGWIQRLTCCQQHVISSYLLAFLCGLTFLTSCYLDCNAPSRLTAIPGLHPSISGGKTENVWVRFSSLLVQTKVPGLILTGLSQSLWMLISWTQVTCTSPKLGQTQSFLNSMNCESERFDPQITMAALFPEQEGRDVKGSGQSQWVFRGSLPAAGDPQQAAA